MSLLHPFQKKIPIEDHTELDDSRFSPEEIKSIQKSLQTAAAHPELLQKSFKHGRANLGENNSSNGLSIQSSDFSSLADAENELQRKRLLREISDNVIVQAILRTRDSQLMKFCQPAEYSTDGVGFRIKPKHVNSSGKLTKQQQKDIKRIERFIYNTGAPDAERPSREKFPQFISSFIRNKFIYDQINVERVFDPDNKKDKLDHFNMVDAGTVVLDRTPIHEDSKRSFLQFSHVSENRKDAIHFDEKHLTFDTSHGGEVGRHGYGYSALEAAMNEIQFERSTEDFNARFFIQGGTTRGILLIDTEQDVQESNATLKKLRQQWQSTAQGLSGAWKIPVLSAHDAKFVNMTQSSKDMEFEKWLNYLINIICSVFQIQPDEINFPNRSGGRANKGSMHEGAAQKGRMHESKAKGLHPLMIYIEHFINDEILSYYAPQYFFVFTMGDDRDELRHQQIEASKLNNGLTVNEWRKSEGLEALDALDNSFSKIPGPPQVVVQEYNAQIAQQEAQQKINSGQTGSSDGNGTTSQQNTANQAQSDIKNNDKPTHQNTVVNTNNNQNH